MDGIHQFVLNTEALDELGLENGTEAFSQLVQAATERGLIVYAGTIKRHGFSGSLLVQGETLQQAKAEFSLAMSEQGVEVYSTNDAYFPITR